MSNGQQSGEEEPTGEGRSPTVPPPEHGTRFELTLLRGEGEGAEYDARILRAEGQWRVRLALGQGEARITECEAGAPEAATAQLVALARTMAKRAGEAPWPRRITRWRQPGVR